MSAKFCCFFFGGFGFPYPANAVSGRVERGSDRQTAHIHPAWPDPPIRICNITRRPLEHLIVEVLSDSSLERFGFLPPTLIEHETGDGRVAMGKEESESR